MATPEQDIDRIDQGIIALYGDGNPSEEDRKKIATLAARKKLLTGQALTQQQPLTGRQRWRDFGMSAASVAPNVASFIAGLPGDLDALGEMALPEVLTKPIGEVLTGKEVKPNPLNPLSYPIFGSAFPGSQQIKEGMSNKAEGMPLAQEIINYQPQTAPGRYTKTVGEFAGSGLVGPTSAARKTMAGLGAGGGLLFQGLEDATGSPAAAAAVTIPSMMVGGYLAGPSRAARMSENAIRTVRKSDIDEAKSLERMGESLGIKLLPGEALNDKGVRQLTEIILKGDKGSAAIYNSIKDRLTKTRQAAERKAGQLGDDPTNIRQTKQMIESTIGTAKQNARRERSLRANAMGYGNLRGAKVGEDQVQKVINTIDKEIRMAAPGGPRERTLKQLKSRITIPVKESDNVGILLADGTPANPLQATKNYKPQTNINKLDETFQEFRDRARYEPGTADAIDKKTWNSLFNQDETGVLNELNKTMRTNIDYRNANDVFALLSDELVAVVDRNLPNLTKAGITPTKVKSFVFDPTNASVGDIKKTYEILNKTDPNAFTQIANLYFRNAIDKAFAITKQGEDLTQGFNLAKSVVGTGNQRKNFMAILDGVADAKKLSFKETKDLKVGFENLFKVLERTARIPSINKPGFVAANQASKTLLKDAAMMQTFNPYVRLTTKYGELQAGGVNKVLGNLMASDDAVANLIELGTMQASSKAAAIRALVVLDSSQAIQNEPDF